MGYNRRHSVRELLHSNAADGQLAVLIQLVFAFSGIYGSSPSHKERFSICLHFVFLSKARITCFLLGFLIARHLET